MFLRGEDMGKKKNIFKSLLINRDQLLNWIKEICDESFETSEVSELSLVGNSKIQYRCEIIVDGKHVCIDFYYNNDNTTTIQPNVGQNQEIGKTIALSILKYIKFDNKDTLGRSYSVHPLERSNFDLILEFLNDLDDCDLIHSTKNETSKYELFQYRSKLGDKLTLKYYENSRLQIQGKPAYLYLEVTSLLAEYFPFDEIVKSQADFFSVDINPTEVREEMKESLPNSYDSLNETLRSILSPSIALRQIDIPLDDYTCYAFPALRALEGYIKSILMNNGIVIGKDGFDIFNKVGRKYVLNNDSCEKINNKEVTNAVEELYNYYHKERHGLFHTEAVAVMTRTIDKQRALQIISDVVLLIETTHTNILVGSKS